jgi:hypothetical protein
MAELLDGDNHSVNIFLENVDRTCEKGVTKTEAGIGSIFDMIESVQIAYFQVTVLDFELQ